MTPNLASWPSLLRAVTPLFKVIRLITLITSGTIPSTTMPLNLNQLRVLEAVARTGSFSRAAEELSVTQPAVTVQIRKLEAHCGVLLFERVRGKGHLTQAGQTLYAYAQRIFALADEAAQTVELVRGFKAGRLRLIAGRTPAASYLPSLVAGFRRRYPEIRIQLLVDTSQRAADGILSLKDDLAVLGEEPRDPHLVREPFCDDRLVLIVPPRHAWTRRRAISLRELTDQPFIQREPGSSTRALIESRMAAAGVALRVTMELGSNEAIKRSVEMGDGVALVSAALVELETQSGRLSVVRTREPEIVRSFYLTYHRERRESPLIRAMLDVAREIHPRQEGIGRRDGHPQ